MRFLKRRRPNRTRSENTFAINDSHVTTPQNGSRVRAAIAARTKGLRQRIRRNRIVLVTLLAVGGVVAVLTGLSLAQGSWYLNPNGQVDTSQPPPPRFGAAATYDQARERIVLFGGFVSETNPSNPASLGGPPISNNAKTHLYRYLAGWEGRDPLHSPSARGYAAMAYDGARQNVVLFGGGRYNSNNVFGDTWTWDGQDWTLQNPPKPVPDPRQNASMVYDPHRKVVMMFGGRDADGKPMNDTWVWNGSAWKIMPPEGAPSPRHSAAINYDVCRAEAVMFGGVGNAENNFYRQPSETWTWDGAKWSPEAPRVSPPPRIGGNLAYSERTGNVLLYGGLITNETGVPTAAGDHDVWRWVPEDPTRIPDGPAPGGIWERMNTESGPAENFTPAGIVGDGVIRTQPPPRAYANFHYLHESSRGSEFLLFGGTPSAGTSGTQFAYGDTTFFADEGQVSIDGDFRDVLSGPPLNQSLPDTPLRRGCDNSVPVPEDDPSQVVTSGPQLATRDGMRDTGQRLPVLVGDNWPANQRNTHVGVGNNRTPNPNYTPAPDCPNRVKEISYYDEMGSSTHLVTDPTRNRVYQFFVCDPNRGQGYLTPTTYYNRPEVYNLLIEVYDGTTLKPLGKAIARNVRWQAGGTSESLLIHDAARGRFLVSTDVTKELVSIQQDRIEKSLDPVTGRRDFSGFTSANTYRLPRNFFDHPTTGRPKLFSDAVGGGLPTAGSPPTVTPGSPPATSTSPKLAQWDLPVMDGETMTKEWEVSVAGGCTHLGGMAMRSGNRVYTTCHVGNNQWAVVRITITENPGGTETPSTAVEVFPGPSMTDSTYPQSWGDPQAERMIIVNESGGGAGGYRMWTFDGKVSRWVGRTGVGAAQTFTGSTANGNHIRWGFDSQAGRFYLHMGDTTYGNTQGGVRIIDTRLTPVPQPLNFPQFASMTQVTPAYLPATADASRRIFIRNGGGKMKKYPNWETIEFENEMFYRVLADNVPLPELSGLSDLDALTQGVPETPGKTEVGFDAEGSAYGIRLRSIGGVWTAARPFQQAYSGLDNNQNLAMPLVRHLIPACVFPDRELMAGWVPQARLSDLDALARSSGLEVDSNSKTDLQAPTSRCNPTANASNFPPSIKVVFDLLWPLKNMLEFEANKAASEGLTAQAGQESGYSTEHIDTPLGSLDVFKNQAGQPTGAKAQTTSSSWDSHFKEVICVGDALNTYQASVGNIYGSSNCVQTQGLVKATAKGSALGAGSAAANPLPDGFSVGEGYSTVEVTRDKDKGVVVTARAIARGIQIPGSSVGTQNIPTLTIDRVESIAVVWSNGRAPTDEEIQTLGERTQFTRYICGVHTPDGSIPGCLSSGQQQQFVSGWNSGWGKNSQIYLPTPDPDYLNGSPGGYIAGVLKPLANAIEDELFAKDSQKEVPALEVHFYKNSQFEGDARQTLQLAAVRAIAGFGVQCDPDHLFSPQTKSCIAIPDEPLDEEFFEEEDEEFFEDEEPGLEGEWIPAEAFLDTGESLGSKIGRLLDRLPIIRQLPIRQMGEALLAASVWVLLGLPLLFAWRRLSLNAP